jgi:hypothetical protein
MISSRRFNLPNVPDGYIQDNLNKYEKPCARRQNVLKNLGGYPRQMIL